MLAYLIAASLAAVPVGSRAAIDSACDRLYPGVKDFRMGLSPKPGETEAPLAEVVAYRATLPVPHWHYITYGLSELGEKVSDDPAMSGFGVEYTLRLVDESPTPPAWPIQLLRYLAAKVRETRNPYDPSHSMNLPDRHMLDKVSPGVEGLGFREDEQLGKIDTPTGKLTFVTVIPLLQGEYGLISSWDILKVFAEIRAAQKDLLWRPTGRKSLLEGDRKDAILKAVEHDGSSQAVEFYALEYGEKEIVLDATAVELFQKMLRHRVAHGRSVKILNDGNRSLELQPGKWSWKSAKTVFTLQVPKGEARAFADELSKAKDKALLTRDGGVRFRLDLAK